ncbi:MAG: FAD-dependent oxidoreductase [Bacteroidota bacterium]
MSKKVIILGGGVAGMSAAHELIERGYEVHMYEKQPVYVGGKARSVDVPDSAQEGYLPLPGEHGFRFFPGFYKHITDTMKRTPFPGNKHGVFDNLVPSERVMMARFNAAPLQNIVNFPRSLADLKVAIHAFVDSGTGLTKKDGDFFASKLWQLATSCYERRNSEYERIAWWDFMDADNQSEAYKQYFVGGITRTLVAAKPKKVSTKTGGDILLQLLFLMGDPATHADRVLNGPTNEAWLYPWRDYLLEKGVQYHHDMELSEIKVENGAISSVMVQGSGGQEEVEGDEYIFAMPVERMAPMLSAQVSALDPTLDFIKPLAKDTAWMTGIQFYLNEDVKMAKGHVMYTDSQWALTSISQLQFWDGYEISNHGNGEVKGVLSVDISDWENPGFNGKCAKDCTKEEIKEEVWKQLKDSLITDGKSLLSDDMLVNWYLDRDIVFGKDFKTANEEPLLINRVNTWSLRPDAFTQIPNMFLASDYVRTYTDLATMEGANEAARRAVNAILNKDGKKDFCKIWNLHEPAILAPFRMHDQKRWKEGLPWKNAI